MTKVCVVCPIGGEVHEKFRETVFNLEHKPILYLFERSGIKYEPTTDVMETNQRRWRVIAKARNQILTTALKLDWDYILWLDSDIEVFPSLIADFLQYTPKEKVISASYLYRLPQKPRYVHVKNSPLPILNFNMTGTLSDGPDDLSNPPYKLAFGFGCVLIAREVHEKTGLFLDTDELIEPEDSTYCISMRKAGFNLFLAPIKVNHFPGKVDGTLDDENPDVVYPSKYRDLTQKLKENPVEVYTFDKESPPTSEPHKE